MHISEDTLSLVVAEIMQKAHFEVPNKQVLVLV